MSGFEALYLGAAGYRKLEFALGNDAEMYLVEMADIRFIALTGCRKREGFLANGYIPELWGRSRSYGNDYLTATLYAVVNGHNQSQTSDLLPWNYKDRLANYAWIRRVGRSTGYDFIEKGPIEPKVKKPRFFQSL